MTNMIDSEKRSRAVSVAIPLVLFIVSSPQETVFNGLMFGMACMGMVSPFPDVYNVILVLKQTKSTDKIMFYGDDVYRIS